MDPSRLLPIFLDVQDRDVLVVGAGSVAARKIADFTDAGARVHVVAIEAIAEIEARAKNREIRLDLRSFEDRDVDDAWLVVSATGDPAVEARVHAAAEARKKFVIAVDDLASGSAASGAVIRRPPFVVAISSSAELPAMTRLLREILERALPEDRWIRAARDLRAKWKREKAPMASRFEELVRAVSEARSDVPPPRR
ncbi:MAG: precorrin-2 dehydrogenase/sirohydrochlorin ferrochelatase family protein [Polyangiaceae bacterium]